MEAEERERLVERSNTLRIELKSWEKDFAASNDGQKASRDDIKKHSEIGQYTVLRCLEAVNQHQLQRPSTKSIIKSVTCFLAKQLKPLEKS